MMLSYLVDNYGLNYARQMQYVRHNTELKETGQRNERKGLCQSREHSLWQISRRILVLPQNELSTNVHCNVLLTDWLRMTQ